jgi:hypothetical protein
LFGSRCTPTRTPRQAGISDTVVAQGRTDLGDDAVAEMKGARSRCSVQVPQPCDPASHQPSTEWVFSIGRFQKQRPALQARRVVRSQQPDHFLTAAEGHCTRCHRGRR